MKKLKVDTLIRFWIIAIVVFMYTMLAFGQNQTSIGQIGPRGYTGARGPAGTLAIGTVTTGDPGSSVIVTNVGTVSSAVLNITIPRGSNILSGSGAPATSIGGVQDYYIDTTAGCLYGPKTNPVGGAWPGTCKSLIGPAGPTGPQGPAGAGNPGGGLHSIQINGVGSTAGSFQPSTFLTDATNSDLLGVRNLTGSNTNDVKNPDLSGGTRTTASNCPAQDCTIQIGAGSSDNWDGGGIFTAPLDFFLDVPSAHVISHQISSGNLDYVEDPNATYSQVAHTIASLNLRRLFNGATGASGGGATTLNVVDYEASPGSYNYGAESGAAGLSMHCFVYSIGINQCTPLQSYMWASGDKVLTCYKYGYWADCGNGNGDDESCYGESFGMNETQGIVPTATVSGLDSANNGLRLTPITGGGQMGAGRPVLMTKNSSGVNNNQVSGCSVVQDSSYNTTYTSLTLSGCTLTSGQVSKAVGTVISGFNTPRNLSYATSQTGVVSVLGVQSVAISTPGSGQTDGIYTINAVGGSGSGAQIKVTISGGVITNVLIVSVGSGYTSIPTFTVSAGGTAGTLTATVSAAFTTSSFACFAGRATGVAGTLGRFEPVRITAVGSVSGGTQSITGNMTENFSTGQVIVMQGGLCETYMREASGNRTTGSVPVTFTVPVVGAYDSTHLVYALIRNGNFFSLSEMYEDVTPTVYPVYLTRVSNVVYAVSQTSYPIINLANTPNAVVASTVNSSFNGTFTPLPSSSYGSTSSNNTIQWAQTAADVTTAVAGTITLGTTTNTLSIYPGTYAIGIINPSPIGSWLSTDYTIGDYISLHDNDIAWAANQTVEMPLGTHGSFTERADYESVNMPGASGFHLTCEGASCEQSPSGHVGGSDDWVGSWIMNAYPYTNYQTFGGRKIPPIAYRTGGVFGTIIDVADDPNTGWTGMPPGGAVIQVHCGFGTTGACDRPDAQYYLLQSDTHNSFADIIVDQANNDLHLVTGGGGGGAWTGLHILGSTMWWSSGANSAASYFDQSLTYFGIAPPGQPQRVNYDTILDLQDGSTGHLQIGSGGNGAPNIYMKNDMGGFGELSIKADGAIALINGRITTTTQNCFATQTDGSIATGNYTHSGCLTSITGTTGQPINIGISGNGDTPTISATVGSSYYLPTTTDKNFWNLSLQYVGTLTLTAAGPDSLSVAGLTSTNHCTASYLTGTPVALGALAGTGSVIISHPTAVAGDTVSVFCN